MNNGNLFKRELTYWMNYRLEFFNATEWVNLFERSGARYAVLTSKHHEVYKGIYYVVVM